ncbi:hypothetical protein LXL04_005000 [Taraxacum kok-saghyz]
MNKCLQLSKNDMCNIKEERDGQHWYIIMWISYFNQDNFYMGMLVKGVEGDEKLTIETEGKKINIGNGVKTKGLFARRSDQRPRLGPRTWSVVCAFDSGRRTRTPDSVRRFASDSVRPKKSQTEFLPVISDSVRGLMSVRGVGYNVACIYCVAELRILDL